jgi:hypothetical protein
MLLNPTPVSSARFTWVPETRTFIAEMSDLGSFDRVYDDACDEGLTLVSANRPGEQIVFAVTRVERDADGDLMYWDLIPAQPQPAARGCTFGVRVFND